MLIRLFNAFYRRFLLNKISKQDILLEQQHEEFLVLKNVKSKLLDSLSEEERDKINSIWGALFDIKSYAEYSIFKTYEGFSPLYLSHYIYLPIVARLLNDFHYTKLFEHKGFLGFLTRGNIRFPKVFVRKISGEYYDSNMNQIKENDIYTILKRTDIVIIKDSVESSGGKSVERLITNTPDFDKVFQNVLREREHDFVIQECLKQHPLMQKFNSSSINTFRITTL